MIYLDHAATTACAPEVVEAMLPYFRDSFANASSIDHLPGIQAKRAVERSRELIAELVGGRVEDVIFTSGSTEANNLILATARRVVTTAIEHPSILDPFGVRKNPDDAKVSVDSRGLVNSEELAALIACDRATLVSVIATNNETGVEQDLTQLLASCKDRDVLFHIDATQGVGTTAFDFRRGHLDGLSLSGHKFYGPKGIGALVASSRLRRELRPILRGGGHERGFRSGTLNVPAIVGMGAAAELAIKHRVSRRAKLSELRRYFMATLSNLLGEDIEETVGGTTRVSPHIASVRIRRTNGRALLGAVREDISFSLGSACATNKAEPSHVLLAMGFDKRATSEVIRVSFSPEQSRTEVEQAATIIAAATRELRSYSATA
jgi:cysteine desulfurase